MIYLSNPTPAGRPFYILTYIESKKESEPPMPELNLGKVELTNESLIGRVFRRTIYRPAKSRQKLTVYIDIELLEQYEKSHPRKNDRSFGGALSDDVNKSLAVWMQAHDLI
jgi:hypothetical protein